MDRVQLDELKDEYVICRTLGHAWEENPHGEVSDDYFNASQGYLSLRCTRCTAERIDYIGNDMAVWSRRYKYPPMYTTIQGEGTRPNLRGEMFRRSLLIQGHQKRRQRK